jgi:hypothetical protein
MVWLVGLFLLQHRASVKRFVSLQFFILRHSVGRLGREFSPSQDRYLTQTQNEHKQTSMSPVGFEPTIPGFERAKTVHALDCVATVTGIAVIVCIYYVKSNYGTCSSNFQTVRIYFHLSLCV